MLTHGMGLLFSTSTYKEGGRTSEVNPELLCRKRQNLDEKLFLMHVISKSYEFLGSCVLQPRIIDMWVGLSFLGDRLRKGNIV